jgi:hypothetical protein
MKRYIFVALVTFMFSSGAFALANTLGFVRVFQLSCDGTVRKIVPASGRTGSLAVLLWNSTSTAVFIGGSDVNTTTTGIPICSSSSCVSSSLSIDSNPVLYCQTAGSTVTLTVLQGF